MRAESRPYSEKVQSLVPEGSSSSLHQVDDDGALSHVQMFIQTTIFCFLTDPDPYWIRIQSD